MRTHPALHRAVGVIIGLYYTTYVCSNTYLHVSISAAIFYKLHLQIILVQNKIFDVLMLVYYVYLRWFIMSTLTLLMIASFRSVIYTYPANMSYKIRTIYILIKQTGEKTNNNLLTNATNQINKCNENITSIIE